MNVLGHLPQLLFVTQLFATFAMTGIVWFVQLVHYPLFLLVPDPHHSTYAIQHQRRTGWVVAPLMLVELATSLLILAGTFRPPFMTATEARIGIALIAIVWLSTVFLQVPTHVSLLKRMDTNAVHGLVTTNWLRTAAWTLRSFLLLRCLVRFS